MSYADFIAALEHEGIEIAHHHTHWDENGVLVVDYESLDDVPHTITLKNTKGHVEDSSDTIDKSGKNSKDHVIDSGEVVTKHTQKSKDTAKASNSKKSSSNNKKANNPTKTKASSNSKNKVSSTAN